jgi:putative flippase GtrA
VFDVAEEPSRAAPGRRGLRDVLGTQFTRFAGAALAALAATEVALTLCNGVLHLTATPAALMSWFTGAVVSYALSRWAWNRTGRPDVLRETIPFWAISVAVIAVLTLANKFGYRSAAWLHLTGARHVLWVDLVWLAANLGTFLLRFTVFHYVLFREIRPSARRKSRSPGHSSADARYAVRHAEARDVHAA